MSNRHDEATKKKALAIYKKTGSSKLAEQEAGVSHSTLMKWTHEAGITNPPGSGPAATYAAARLREHYAGTPKGKLLAKAVAALQGARISEADILSLLSINKTYLSVILEVNASKPKPKSKKAAAKKAKAPAKKKAASRPRPKKAKAKPTEQPWTE